MDARTRRKENSFDFASGYALPIIADAHFQQSSDLTYTPVAIVQPSLRIANRAGRHSPPAVEMKKVASELLLDPGPMTSSTFNRLPSRSDSISK